MTTTVVRKQRKKGISLRKAIDNFCIACVGGIKKDVTNCTAPHCPLWQVRPYQKEQK